MNSLDLFAKIYDELEVRCQSSDWYDILKCSGLLRQLLLDATPLVDSANRQIRLRIHFEISDDSYLKIILGIGRPMAGGRFGGLLPERGSLVGCKKEMVSRDRFLNTPCLFNPDGVWTVKDVIVYLANSDGGIHYEEIPNPGRDMMRKLARISHRG